MLNIGFWNNRIYTIFYHRIWLELSFWKSTINFFRVVDCRSYLNFPLTVFTERTWSKFLIFFALVSGRSIIIWTSNVNWVWQGWFPTSWSGIGLYCWKQQRLIFPLWFNLKTVFWFNFIYINTIDIVYDVMRVSDQAHMTTLVCLIYCFPHLYTSVSMYLV